MKETQIYISILEINPSDLQVIHCALKRLAVAREEEEETTEWLKDLGDPNTDLMDWAREEAMAAFTCPLLGMFLIDWVAVAIGILVFMFWTEFNGLSG